MVSKPYEMRPRLRGETESIDRRETQPCGQPDYDLGISRIEWVGRHNETAVRFLRKFHDNTFNVGDIVQLCWRHGYAHQARLSLRRSQKFDIGWDILIVEHAHAAHPWCGLLQEFQPFSPDVGLEILKPGDIAARMREVRYQTAADRIGHQDKDDGDRLCRLLHRGQTWIRPNVNQFRPACGDLSGASTNPVIVLGCEMHIELD